VDLMLLRLFQTDVLSQCDFTLLAAREVNEGLHENDVTRTFAGLQSLLNAAANISKALWGQGGRFAAQRQPLRDSIGITDASPLRTVTMRNKYEHFDERLDKWWSESQNHNHLDFSIMPISGVAGFDQNDMFRVFDPTSTNLYFWGQEFNVQELINEVQRILPKLRAEASKPHWEVGPTGLAV
jgi:hypothetical protein